MSLAQTPLKPGIFVAGYYGDTTIQASPVKAHSGSLRPSSIAGWIVAALSAAYAIYAFMDIDGRSHSVSDTLMNFAFRLPLLFLVYSAVARLFSRRTTSD